MMTITKSQLPTKVFLSVMTLFFFSQLLQFVKNHSHPTFTIEVVSPQSIAFFLKLMIPNKIPLKKFPFHSAIVI
jgi:hypothetical protein